MPIRPTFWIVRAANNRIFKPAKMKYLLSLFALFVVSRAVLPHGAEEHEGLSTTNNEQLLGEGLRPVKIEARNPQGGCGRNGCQALSTGNGGKNQSLSNVSFMNE
jgi:hypothetical protein